MSLKKQLDVSGKDHCRLLYQTELQQEAEWLRRGAIEKTNSIQYLLKNNSIEPQTILELGCGTGAVVQECQRRGISQRYVAVDYSEEAITHLRSNSEGIETIIADITAADFSLESAFDVVILSHVLEHLEEPCRFLESVSRKINFSHLIIEVPLEDLFVSKIKLLFRDRRTNKAGHVQFFTVSTFTKLLVSNEFRIIDERLYAPILDIETVRFVCDKDGLSKPQYIVKIATGHYLPKLLRPLWVRLYYAHYAVLCKKA